MFIAENTKPEIVFKITTTFEVSRVHALGKLICTSSSKSETKLGTKYAEYRNLRPSDESWNL
jgi:hypothetical protein